jgi:hypothetical protein
MEQERMRKSILTAFDSVNLINELNIKLDKNEYEISRLERNKEHLKIMLKKDWFLSNLTETQKLEIESCLK